MLPEHYQYNLKACSNGQKQLSAGNYSHRDRRESFCSENKNFPTYTVRATGNSTLPPCPLPHCFLGSTSEPLQQSIFSFKQQPLTLAFGAASPNTVPFTQQDSFKPLKEEENATSSLNHIQFSNLIQ